MHFSIPEVSQVNDVNQGSFTVYHVHANGILHCKLRFKQFNNFHEQLKRQFGVYSLPYFPPKKLFPLKEIQIEERRALLEKYMQIISQDERIANSAPFNDFLLNAQQESLHAVRELIKLEVLLADNSRVHLNAMSTDNSSTVKETICRELKLPIKYTPFFSLFIVKQVEQDAAADERTSNRFSGRRESNHRNHSNDKFINSSRPDKANCKYVLIRKMMDFEAPCLSLQNANETANESASPSAGPTIYHLQLRKFYWNIELDDRLVENEVALNLLYLQAQADFERQSNELNRDHQQYLETLALRQSKKEYLTFAKCVKNYGLMQFEQCVCDFPKPNTNCVISIKSNELILRTLFHSNGRLSKGKDFILRITRIRCWRLTTGFDLRSPYGARKAPLLASPEDDHKYELSIEYLISKDDLRWIVVKSEQAVLMSTCLKSVIEELVLKKNQLPLYEEKSSEISVNLRKNSCNYYKSNDKSLANSGLVFGRSMEKSLSVETFLVGPNKFNNNHDSQPKSRKVLVQNSAYDGIGDDDL